MTDDTAPPDLVMLLARRWKTIALCAVLGGAAGVAYGTFAPAWFQARLTVVPSQRSGNPALGLIANLPGADALGAGTGIDVQRIEAVLTSNSVADDVIAKFDLQNRYDCAHLEQARTALWEHCATSVDHKSSVVTLTCEDKDPEQAKVMAEYFGDVGNRVFGRISTSSAHEERRFLESQVVKARTDVDDASRKLRDFQELHKIVDLPEQSKAVISAMATVEGQLVSKEIEMSYLSGFSSQSESSVVQLRQQIAIMEAKLTELQEAEPGPAAGSAASAAGSAAPRDPSKKFFPDAMAVPQLRFELEQLMREQKIEETVFFLMTQRFETAKVDEARDTPTFQILDHPTLPTYKSRPQRKRSAMLGAAGGLAVAGALILLPTWWRRRRMAVPA